MAEFDSVIPAGQSGKLTAKIKTNINQSGTLSKSISVTTDAPGAERLMLNLRFNVVSAITILPRPQLMISGLSGDENVSTLILRRNDGKPLEITKLECSDKRLIAASERLTKERTVERRQALPGDVLVTLTAAKELPPVTSAGTLVIGTNHPDAERLELRFSLRLRPMIEPRPTQVRLILQEGNETNRMALLRVQHNRRRDFKITGARPSDPDLFRVDLVDRGFEQQVHTVAVMLQDDVKPGAIETRKLETLILETNDPEQPEVKVSVLIEPRGMARPGSARPNP